ncbi:two component transcriptional regulator, winged helix family protein [Minicystis rosea]|nr:two component transcriptional regulator, winged helix family protein [Minicystis rosea]
MKILIVEDDTKVARFLARVLTEEGFMADLCASGEGAVEQARSGVYDLVVLDWMLPDLDGLSVCRELRRLGMAIPILMLTARGELRERVLGLTTGADDYLVKPFEIEELLARVRALLRRAATATRLVHGDLEIDRMARRAHLGGAPLDLTNREYALLLHLAQRVDQVVPKSELLARVWDTSFDTGSNLVEVHVSRLRDKLGAHAWMIETVRGVGYRLRGRRDP